MTAPTPPDVSAVSDLGVERDPGSFRDPAGFVYRRGDELYRQVGPSAIDDWKAFDASGLAEALQASRRLVRHEAVVLDLAATADARAVIRPEPVDFISYPYEWTFGELQDAALLTLDVQLDALRAGWTLKDASAYNVAFHQARPILIDSLSFEPYQDGRPWAAYRQFCEHFLAPLALMARRDIRLSRLLRADPDGIPLDLAKALLPWRTRLDFGLLSHVHLHANAQARHQGGEDDARVARSVTIGRSRLEGLIGNLRATVARLRWAPGGTEWSEYADHTSYSDAATAEKLRLVQDYAARVPGNRAWDLGANTGRYSRTVADTGKHVLAFDIDPAAAERNYRAIVAEGRHDILPLVMDLANPSPGIGWMGEERRSLMARANPDLIVALALVHHLAISRNVPLLMVMDLFARMSPWAIVEFVPKADSMVRHLLATREDVFPDYTLEGFRRAATVHYEVVIETAIADSQRTLFLLHRRSAPGRPSEDSVGVP